jgi:hypothetical protein
MVVEPLAPMVKRVLPEEEAMVKGLVAPLPWSVKEEVPVVVFTLILDPLRKRVVWSSTVVPLAG